MHRTARLAPGGMLFHVLNRGVGRMRLFQRDADYEAFERTIAKTLESIPLRLWRRVAACSRHDDIMGG